MAEQLPHKELVDGSSPSGPTIGSSDLKKWDGESRGCIGLGGISGRSIKIGKIGEIIARHFEM
jgi:hypothetical protein